MLTTTVRANAAGARALRLDAVGFESLEIVGDDAPAWRYDGRAIDLTWPRPLAQGEER